MLVAMKRVGRLGVLLLCVVAFAACSSGSSSTTKDRTTTTSHGKRRPKPTTTTSSTTAPTDDTSPTTVGTVPGPSETPPPAPSGSGCGDRSGPVIAAVQNGDLGGADINQFTITDCRIAEANPIWAAVTLVPKGGAGRLTAVLQRVGSIWTIYGVGPTGVGCDTPAPVPTQLRLGC